MRDDEGIAWLIFPGEIATPFCGSACNGLQAFPHCDMMDSENHRKP
jgi:hypothetical protein